MPITRRQFEWGVDESIEAWMVKIREFLASHKDEAFTIEELWKLIYSKTAWQTSVREAFDQAMIKLVEIGQVGGRVIRGVEYYINNEGDLPF